MARSRGWLTDGASARTVAFRMKCDKTWPARPRQRLRRPADSRILAGPGAQVNGSSSASRGGNPRAAARRPLLLLAARSLLRSVGFAGVFFTAWASDFGRFLPATSDSFPVDVFQGHPTEVAPVGCAKQALGEGRSRPSRNRPVSVALLRTLRARPTCREMREVRRVIWAGAAA
jgi:hypothetical protein